MPKIKLSSEEILTIGAYFPRYNDLGKKDKWSSEILNIKNSDSPQDNGTILAIIKLLIGIVKDYPKLSVAVVPSHKKDDYDPRGIRFIAGRLARNFISNEKFFNATRCLHRYKEIDKLASGGDRGLQVHYNSIKVEYPKLIQGKAVLLLDDVVTTGHTMIACKRLLLKAGAARVYCLALGRTANTSIASSLTITPVENTFRNQILSSEDASQEIHNVLNKNYALLKPLQIPSSFVLSSSTFFKQPKEKQETAFHDENTEVKNDKRFTTSDDDLLSKRRKIQVCTRT